MSQQKEPANNPFHDLKCIWMSSHTVEYKLCDRNFDCENCPFDKVIRNLSVENNGEKYLAKDNSYNLIDSVTEQIKALSYESKLIYLKNRLVVKHLFSNTYYLGIDPFYLLFLDSIKEVQDCGHSGYILKNQGIFNVKGDWGFITFSSPMNFLMLDKLDVTAGTLAETKWFAIIGVNLPEITTARISRDNWNYLRFDAISNLKSFKNQYPQVGATMNDGGSKVKSLNQLIGDYDYVKLLSKLINS